MLAFDKLDRDLQTLCETTFGVKANAGTPPAIVYHPMRERPSARPVVDPDRPVAVLADVILSGTHERVNLGDNGMGRLSGKNNLSVAAQAVEIAFAKAQLGYLPRRRDEVTIAGERYSVAEVMDDGGAAWSLRLNRLDG